ncbi:hypothetical protein K443DRAFT_152456 [Laccaria amethystina LaAM-08-1]|uniref:Uncharacterized protein n=1 Tax=Laccaria amethystina LaAM-08-1 TaxID=1095629 RepID=A0A0C9YIF0_9AGAR|nr:hypothetical protein K443DRAFT_152456 [Laccaria amethystina LaAM-08-1]
MLTDMVVIGFSLWCGLVWGIAFCMLDSVGLIFTNLHGFDTGLVGTTFSAMMDWLRIPNKYLSRTIVPLEDLKHGSVGLVLPPSCHVHLCMVTVHVRSLECTCYQNPPLQLVYVRHL